MAQNIKILSKRYTLVFCSVYIIILARFMSSQYHTHSIAHTWHNSTIALGVERLDREYACKLYVYLYVHVHCTCTLYSVYYEWLKNMLLTYIVRIVTMRARSNLHITSWHRKWKPISFAMWSFNFQAVKCIIATFTLSVAFLPTYF